MMFVYGKWRKSQRTARFCALLVAIGFSAFVSGAQTVQRTPNVRTTGSETVSDPKADCEALMNSALPFAEQMLTTHGEFFPFGAAMRIDGQLVSVAGYEGDENPRSTDVIRLIKAGFIQGAHRGQYKATAVLYDVRVKLPSTGDTSDAIAVSLNHRDHYSIVVIFPYKISRGKLMLGDAFAQNGESDIFPPR
jgi:hypothetical protein